MGPRSTSKGVTFGTITFHLESFLKNNENKSDLFCFLSKEIERTSVSRKILVSTCSDSLVSSSTEVDLNHMSGYTHEGADEENNTNC